ncbi:phage tail tip lysozyme [Saccharothrix sp. AJ9571]|nr:phage tail tip lysozyme [Saccharothrix sp. AJ9571]
MATDQPTKPDEPAQSGAPPPSPGAPRKSLGVPSAASDAGSRSLAGGPSTSGRPIPGPVGRGTKSLSAGGSGSGLPQRAMTGAGSAAGKAVEGGGESHVRRYGGRAVAGGVNGALQGGLHGAALGAAKEAGLEAAQDTTGATRSRSADGPAGTRLGAGGTSVERGSAKADEGMAPKVAKGVAVGGAAAATPPAMAAVMLMALLNWLKSMFFAFLAMAANMANLLWTLVVTLIKALGHAVIAPFVALGGFLANTAGAVLGVTVTAAMAPVAAAMSGLVATVAAVALVSTVLTGVLSDTALTEGEIGSSRAGCAITTSGGGDGALVPANTEANAKAVYSVLRTWGMPQENIAGILGNWSQESGVDPTSVEAIFSEPYTIGPRKKATWDGGFTHIPGQSHGGIGLGQWSNGRTTMLLDYAEAKGMDWYTIEAQLAFMVEGDNPGDVQVFKDMITNSRGSPSEAAYHFHNKWERSADNASKMAERANDAQMWFATMSGWTVDESVAGGVTNITGDLASSVEGGVRTIADNCPADDEAAAGAGSVSPQDGGMTEAEATTLIDLFNQEGDKFLDTRYGQGGGPGSCGSNHAMNCVSFSTYFVNKYTTFQSYPAGNGIRTAHTIAEQTGIVTSSTPTPYSIGSGPGSGPAGHTLVVLGVQGDTLILGEAGYCAFMGRVRVASASEMAAQGWQFVDMSDAMLPADQIRTA